MPPPLVTWRAPLPSAAISQIWPSRRKTIESARALAGVIASAIKTSPAIRIETKLARAAENGPFDQVDDHLERDRRAVDRQVVEAGVARVVAVEVAHVGLAGAVGLLLALFDVFTVAGTQPHRLLDTL